MSLLMVVFCVALCVWAYFDTKKPKNFPPGPRWYPLVGCALELGALRKKNGGSLTKATGEWASRYGALIGAKIGVNRIVFVYGVKALRELYTREEFNGRPKGVFYTSRTWDKRLGIMFTESAFWQEQRKFVMRHLKEIGPERIGMSDGMRKETLAMIGKIARRIEVGGGGCVLRMDDFFDMHVSNAIWAAITGTLSDTDDGEMKRLQAATELFAQFDMVGPLFSHFPVLRHVCPDLSGYNKYVNTHRKVCELIREEVERVKKTESTAWRGIIGGFLKVLNSSDKDDSFSEEQLLAICLDLFIVGSDTSSKSLAISFLYLLLHPEVQQKAQEEIDRVVGRDRLPDLTDRPQLQYVECVFLESLRMYVARGHFLPHRSVVDTHFNGHFIPKDTLLIPNPQGNHMDADAGWEDPKTFNPERFIKNGAIEIPDYFIPFSLGKHRCVAEALSRANLPIALACLLQKFNFIALPYDPPSEDFVDGFTPRVKPYKAMVGLR